MARNENVEVPAKTWTELTNTDVTEITFQVGDPVHIVGTVGATPPTSVGGSIRYPEGTGERNVALSELFPGVSGATRVYAWSFSGSAVTVSHA